MSDRPSPPAPPRPLGRAAASIDAELPLHWRRLRRDDVAGIARASTDLACNFPPASEGFEEDETLILSVNSDGGVAWVRRCPHEPAFGADRRGPW